jgi:hypothetical protein
MQKQATAHLRIAAPVVLGAIAVLVVSCKSNSGLNTADAGKIADAEAAFPDGPASVNGPEAFDAGRDAGSTTTDGPAAANGPEVLDAGSDAGSTTTDGPAAANGPDASETETTSDSRDPGLFATTGGMVVERKGHAAALLQNDEVLIAGGRNADGYLASAELYDPASGTFAATGAMSKARYHPTATVLSNGMVFVAGGSIVEPDGSSDPSIYLSDAELYDPASGTFSPANVVIFPRAEPSATLLTNGKVLIAGGYGGPDASMSASLYDPATASSTHTGAMSGPRYGHTATLLANGKVLIAGGRNGSGAAPNAELYDPTSGTFSSAGSMTTGRAGCTATLLANGQVLIAGGDNHGIPQYYVCYESAELFDPAAVSFVATGVMTETRAYQTASLLPSGKVLIAGGSNGTLCLQSAELYDPLTGGFAATDSMKQPRLGHTATSLANGKVLVAGGYDGSAYLSSAEIY